MKVVLFYEFGTPKIKEGAVPEPNVHPISVLDSINLNIVYGSGPIPFFVRFGGLGAWLRGCVTP